MGQWRSERPLQGRAVTIVKVGGSLLERADLADRLRRWFEGEPAARHIFLPGGGPLVDEVRRWHAKYPIEESEAHWICIDLMSVTARLLQTRLPEFALVTDYEQLAGDGGDERPVIFDPVRWLREIEPKQPGMRLPPSWDVTSDAIAGRLAVVCQADRLVLWKWTAPTATGDVRLRDLANEGYIDPTLADLDSVLPPVEFVGLAEP